MDVYGNEWVDNDDWDDEEPIQPVLAADQQQQGFGRGGFRNVGIFGGGFGGGRFGDAAAAGDGVNAGASGFGRAGTFGRVGTFGQRVYQGGEAVNNGGFGNGGGFGRGGFGNRFGEQNNPNGFGINPRRGFGYANYQPPAAAGAPVLGGTVNGWTRRKQETEEDRAAALETKINAAKLKSGLIRKVQVLADDISRLYNNQYMSDVTLVVEGQRFPAHKLVLSIRSKYFKAMFCTGLQESNAHEVTLMGTPAKPFALLLSYAYSGQMQLQDAEYKLTLEVFALAHKYEFPVLQEQIVEYLQAILAIQNISSIYLAAELYSFPSLLDHCLAFLMNYKVAVVVSEDFLRFSLDVVKVVVEADWMGSEDIIADALKRWAMANVEQIEELRPIIKPLQLELVEIDNKMHFVKTLGVLGKESCSSGETPCHVEYNYLEHYENDDWD